MIVGQLIPQGSINTSNQVVTIKFAGACGQYDDSVLPGASLPADMPIEVFYVPVGEVYLYQIIPVGMINIATTPVTAIFLDDNQQDTTLTIVPGQLFPEGLYVAYITSR